MPTAPFIAPERDESHVLGRPKQGSTAYYSIPGVIGVNDQSTTAVTSGTDTYWPMYVRTPIVVDQLAFEVTTLAAGQNARVGLYRADRDWQPISAPLADSGSISLATTGVKTYTPGTAIFLQRGRYLSVINYDGGSPAFRGAPGAVEFFANDTLGAGSLYLRNYTVTRAYAAFPTPGTAWTTITNGASPSLYMIWLRVSVP